MAGSLGDLGAADRYAYANDDPVNKVDPSGKQNISAACIVGAIVGVVGLALTVAFGVISGGGSIALAIFAVETIPPFDLLVAAFIGCITAIVGQAAQQALGS